MQSIYLPEGNLLQTKANQLALSGLQGLEKAQKEGATLEAIALSCDTEHNLHLDLNGISAIIPREECALGIRDGSARDIAILSRVGKPVCFKIMELAPNGTSAVLSRVQAQEEAESFFFRVRKPGDILTAKVTHLEPFGAFVDIGCGIISLIGIENISVSRIFHPSERFAEGQDILAVVSGLCPEQHRIYLTHKELLGTWQENADLFTAGETVTGIVRSIEDYGIFIELRPNLSGLAEYREDVQVGQTAAVYIKSILPERMKIKLAIIHTAEGTPSLLHDSDYRIRQGRLTHWQYSPDCCSGKSIVTDFSQA